MAFILNLLKLVSKYNSSPMNFVVTENNSFEVNFEKIYIWEKVV